MESPEKEYCACSERRIQAMELIKLEQFSFSYPDGNEVLKDISLSLENGSFTVLCGHSGCGKSTLLRQLKTSLRPYGKRDGHIFFKGKDLEDTDDKSQSAHIGFVMQDPDSQIVTDKVWHELSFGLESMGCDTETIRLRVAEMASYFGISGWFYKNVDELSGGQKQLLNLASIMTMHPSLLILDEPTSQLDPIAARDFLGTIHKINEELGITVLLTEHRLEEVMPMADKVVVMDAGSIIYEDKPQNIGLWLYRNKHKMFHAMPAPVQIYSRMCKKCLEDDAHPVTVREGRQWLDKKMNWDYHTGCFKKEGQMKSHNVDKEPINEEIMELRDVWFRYEKSSPDVVKGVNVKIKKGEFYCLLGGNGTGKSTTLSLMSRIRHPYRGRILIDGKDIRKYSDKELYRKWIGVVPQNPQSLFVKKTVRLELYEMIGGPKEVISEEYPVDMEKRAVIEKMAEITELSHLLDHHPYDLSGGEQQRLALAKILLLRPRILLMDEPTKGLDASYKNTFAKILKKLKSTGVTIFMISHDIEFCASHSDRCGMFFDGTIVTENTPDLFFAGNSFYTTSANRMARHIWPNAVTADDVLGHIREREAAVYE